jgi:tRNA (guanine26-N2/guanine27-N2)-dimethyltransferase
MITEGAITLPIDVPDTVRKDMSPFYNPTMRTNREITMGVLEAHSDDVDAFFPLAGTGIRPLRCLKETNTLSSAVVNDINQHFPDRFSSYAEQNNVGLEDVRIEQEDARSLAFDLRSFDFVEVDPFGSPNKYLDSCIQQLRDGGVIAVTATDTAPLSGTYPTTCRRKYWADPRRTYEMHEFGLRILIRKIQLVGAQHNRALTPLVSYASDHYFKAIFTCDKSKKAAHKIQREHETVLRGEDRVGPMWTGRLGTADAISFDTTRTEEKTTDLVSTLTKEYAVGALGFFDIHEAASDDGVGAPPPVNDVLQCLEDNGHRAERTHFSSTGVRTNASYDEFLTAVTDVSG